MSSLGTDKGTYGQPKEEQVSQIVPEPSGMHVLTVRMSAPMIGELGRLARQEGCSMSVLVRQAVEHELARHHVGVLEERPNPGNTFYTVWRRQVR